MLLDRLCEVYGGFYWQAEETEPGENLASLSDAYSRWVNGPGPIRFQNWNEAFAALTSQRAVPTPIVAGGQVATGGRAAEVQSVSIGAALSVMV
jgi:hypothetical protein